MDARNPAGSAPSDDVGRVESLVADAAAAEGGRVPPYLEAAEAAVAGARSLPAGVDARHLLGRALVELGEARRRLGDFRSALEALDEALALISSLASEGHRTVSWWGLAHHRIGVVHDSAGNLTAATTAFRGALETYAAAGDAAGVAQVQNSLGIVLSRTEAYDEAVQHFEASLAHARQHGQAAREASVLTNLSIATRLLGRHADAVTYAERSLPVKGAAANDTLPGRRTNLALALAAAGRDEEAAAAFAEAREAHVHHGDVCDFAEHLRAYGEFLLDRGQPDDALDPLERSLALARDAGATGLEAAAHERLAQRWKAVGDHRRALEHFERFHALSLSAERADAARERDAQRWQAEIALARAETAAAKREREALALQYDRLVRDHRQLEGRAAELRHEATIDPLTLLPNRRAFDQRLDHELAVARRTGLACTLLLFDLDGFKVVNDVHGHAVGDAVLRAFAAILARGVRVNDMAARIGGEEFSVILPATGLVPGLVVARKLRRRIRERKNWTAAATVRVTTSIGVASSDEVATEASALIALADERLYEAKRRGRDRVVPRSAQSPPPMKAET